MWFFVSPEIVYGEDALSYLEQLEGARALIVTDPTLHALGFSDRVAAHLQRAGMAVELFAEVEPEPSIQTVQRGVAVMNRFQPEWIVGLGGGSAIDAAKAIWALYERPDLAPEEISPITRLGLSKVRMAAIPTTSGTGSEVTWMVILTDTEERRKLSLGNRELTPTVAIIDPALSKELPARITADTGIDALTHAVEGFTNNFRSEFTDGLCLTAIGLIFRYLPAAVSEGAANEEARERMANAATIAGLGFGNSYVGLAHTLGHSLGAYFKIPHGRAVGLFLPYVIEFTANAGFDRYGEIARFLQLHGGDAEREGADVLVRGIRDLMQAIEQPATITALGIPQHTFEEALPALIANAEIDASIVAAPRMPETAEIEHLLRSAYSGERIDF